MFIQSWKKDIFTIPNLLSLIRLLLIPVYVMIYLQARSPRDYYTAGIILTLSCITDAADGMIARKYHMISTLGKFLDPLADKLTQITLSICLGFRYPVLFYVTVLLLTKEILQIIGSILVLKRGCGFPSSLWAGKISTLILFSSLIFLVFVPHVRPETVTYIALTDCIFLIFAFVTYLSAFFLQPGNLQPPEK